MPQRGRAAPDRALTRSEWQMMTAPPEALAAQQAPCSMPTARTSPQRGLLLPPQRSATRVRDESCDPRGRKTQFGSV